MISVVRQLNHWRFRERLIRLAWGFGRWFAIVGSVLLFACLADWLIDRYAGSQTWRDVRKSSWVFAPADLLSIGETPLLVVPRTAHRGATRAGGRSRIRPLRSPLVADSTHRRLCRERRAGIPGIRPPPRHRDPTQPSEGRHTRHVEDADRRGHARGRRDRLAAQHDVAGRLSPARLGDGGGRAGAPRVGRLLRRQPGARNHPREAASSARRRDPAVDSTGERHPRRLADRLRGRGQVQGDRRVPRGHGRRPAPGAGGPARGVLRTQARGTNRNRHRVLLRQAATPVA